MALILHFAYLICENFWKKKTEEGQDNNFISKLILKNVTALYIIYFI